MLDHVLRYPGRLRVAPNRPWEGPGVFPGSRVHGPQKPAPDRVHLRSCFRRTAVTCRWTQPNRCWRWSPRRSDWCPHRSKWGQSHRPSAALDSGQQTEGKCCLTLPERLCLFVSPSVWPPHRLPAQCSTQRLHRTVNTSNPTDTTTQRTPKVASDLLRMPVDLSGTGQ